MTGIKVGPDGLIYTTTSSFSVEQSAAFVWRTERATGIVEKFATLDHRGFPNDMAFEDDGFNSVLEGVTAHPAILSVSVPVPGAELD